MREHPFSLHCHHIRAPGVQAFELAILEEYLPKMADEATVLLVC